MFNKNFYPTPIDLAYTMLSKTDIKKHKHILEPSAGKGDIVQVIKSRIQHDRHLKICIDVIENDKELQGMLKSKSLNLIHDDFLTFNSHKKYSLIIMNPPFDDGVKHLLKAIDIQRRGGEIVCLLNAETIKNPYSNERDLLRRHLEEYEADIQYIENAFTQAERKTGVETALIHIKIPENRKSSLILDSLKNEIRVQAIKEQNTITSNDPVKSAIERYNFEIQAGLNLIYNYYSMKPILMDNLKVDMYSSCILELTVKGESKYSEDVINDYIEEVRYKYWRTLIDMDVFRQILTSDLIYQFNDKLTDLKQYDFTKFNINQIMAEFESNLQSSVEDTIYSLFKDFTYKYSYNEFSSNIHLFDGWKTNECYKINEKKVIMPNLNAFDDYCGSYYPTERRVENKIRDIEMALNYLDQGRTENEYDIRKVLEIAGKEGMTKGVEFKYFTIDFFKKGTAHIIWKDKELIKKLNIFGSRKEGKLPPAYGRKSYSQMNAREKAVIDSFEGQKSYEETCIDTQFYLFESSGLKMLTGM